MINYPAIEQMIEDARIDWSRNNECAILQVQTNEHDTVLFIVNLDQNGSGCVTINGFRHPEYDHDFGDDFAQEPIHAHLNSVAWDFITRN